MTKLPTPKPDGLVKPPPPPAPPPAPRSLFALPPVFVGGARVSPEAVDAVVRALDRELAGAHNRMIRAIAERTEREIMGDFEAGTEAAIRADERERILNHPEFLDFVKGVVIEAQHQGERWNDSEKTDFDWHAVACYLAAKALLNPAQNDGTTGRAARLHRIVALAALCANWHEAVKARDDES